MTYRPLLYYQTGVAVSDTLTGIFLLFAPVFTLRMMHIAVPDSAVVFISWIGAFVVSRIRDETYDRQGMHQPPGNDMASHGCFAWHSGNLSSGQHHDRPPRPRMAYCGCLRRWMRALSNHRPAPGVAETCCLLERYFPGGRERHWSL